MGGRSARGAQGVTTSGGHPRRKNAIGDSSFSIMLFHSLEARLLFAGDVPWYVSARPIVPTPVPVMSVSVDGDTLTVNGTNYGDLITVEIVSGTVKVTGTTWSPAGVSSINQTYGLT